MVHMPDQVVLLDHRTGGPSIESFNHVFGHGRRRKLFFWGAAASKRLRNSVGLLHTIQKLNTPVIVQYLCNHPPQAADVGLMAKNAAEITVLFLDL
jgi:hypothetical protein